MEGTKLTEEEQLNNEIQLVNVYCFGLIKRANQANAEKMTINQENVTYLDEKVGNWRITIEKIN